VFPDAAVTREDPFGSQSNDRWPARADDFERVASSSWWIGRLSRCCLRGVLALVTTEVKGLTRAARARSWPMSRRAHWWLKSGSSDPREHWIRKARNRLAWRSCADLSGTTASSARGRSS